jgi:hypothetical protein
MGVTPSNFVAPRRFVWESTPSRRYGKLERVSRQVLELRFAQVGAAIRLLRVLKPSRARLASWSSLFAPSTMALLPRSTMALANVSKRLVSVAASLLKGSWPQRRAQFSQALMSALACLVLLCARGRAYTSCSAILSRHAHAFLSVEGWSKCMAGWLSASSRRPGSRNRCSCG